MEFEWFEVDVDIVAEDGLSNELLAQVAKHHVSVGNFIDQNSWNGCSTIKLFGPIDRLGDLLEEWEFDEDTICVYLGEWAMGPNGVMVQLKTS